MQKIVNNRTNPFEMTIERYDTPFPVQISLGKRAGAGKLTSSLSNYNFMPLYTNYRPIKRQKYNDLMKLLQYVPPEFHVFYKQLHSDDENKSMNKRKHFLESSDEEN